MFGTVIDTGLKFYAVPFTPPIHDLKVKVTEVKVFRTSLFLPSVVYLFHVWHDDRCGPKFYVVRPPTPYMTSRSRSRT